MRRNDNRFSLNSLTEIGVASAFGALLVLGISLLGCSQSWKEIEAEGQAELDRQAEVTRVRSVFVEWLTAKLTKEKSDLSFWKMSVESSACPGAWSSRQFGMAFGTTQDESATVKKVGDKRYELQTIYWLRGKDFDGQSRSVSRNIVGIVAWGGQSWQVASHEFKDERPLTGALQLGSWLSLSLLPFMACWLAIMALVGTVCHFLADLSERLAVVVLVVGAVIGALAGGIISIRELVDLSSSCFGPQPVAWIATVLGTVVGLCILVLFVLDFLASEGLLAWLPEMVGVTFIVCMKEGGPGLWIATGMTLIVGAFVLAVISKIRRSSLLLLNALGSLAVGLTIGLAGLLA